MGLLAGETNADLSGLTIVMMDDYILPDGDGFVHCPSDAHFSCHRFAHRDIRDVLNAGLPDDHCVAEDNIYLPDPADPQAYEEKIAEAGGIDLFLIASGASDGHVAFNAPGVDLDSQTRIVDLPETTRRDNLETFPDFTNLDEVPLHGVTVGLGTIVNQSRRIVLVIHGPGKINAVTRLKGYSDFTPDWPASVIYHVRDGKIMLDESATSDLK